MGDKMNIKENGKMYCLVQLARDGDLDARNKLIELNYPLIINKATLCYKKLDFSYYQLYKQHIRSYIIDIDDIVQDFSYRTINILNTYLHGKSQLYFSIYLNMMLTSYTNKFLKNTLMQIKQKKQFEINRNLHYDTNVIIENSDNQLIRDLKIIANTDKRIGKFEDFINYILDGYSFKELSKITGLDKRRLVMKIKYVAELYKIRDNKINIKKK